MSLIIREMRGKATGDATSDLSWCRRGPERPRVLVRREPPSRLADVKGCSRHTDRCGGASKTQSGARMGSGNPTSGVYPGQSKSEP